MQRLRRAARVAVALGFAVLMVGCGTLGGQLAGAFAEGFVDGITGHEPDYAERDRQKDADEFAKDMMRSDSDSDKGLRVRER